MSFRTGKKAYYSILVLIVSMPINKKPRGQIFLYIAFRSIVYASVAEPYHVDAAHASAPA
jgi:hypothetical protein